MISDSNLPRAEQFNHPESVFLFKGGFNNASRINAIRMKRRFETVALTIAASMEVSDPFFLRADTALSKTDIQVDGEQLKYRLEQ